MNTVILEITLWDATKVAALIAKIESDARVLSVKEVSR